MIVFPNSLSLRPLALDASSLLSVSSGPKSTNASPSSFRNLAENLASRKFDRRSAWISLMHSSNIRFSFAQSGQAFDDGGAYRALRRKLLFELFQRIQHIEQNLRAISRSGLILLGEQIQPRHFKTVLLEHLGGIVAKTRTRAPSSTDGPHNRFQDRRNIVGLFWALCILTQKKVMRRNFASFEQRAFIMPMLPMIRNEQVTVSWMDDISNPPLFKCLLVMQTPNGQITYLGIARINAGFFQSHPAAPKTARFHPAKLQFEFLGHFFAREIVQLQVHFGFNISQVFDLQRH